jgi:uncharacterized membrane protein YqjE
MAESQSPPGSEPLFAGVQRETTRLAGEVRWALGKRWDLARLELAIAGLQFKRLTIWLAACVLAALTVLPLLVVLAADCLGNITSWSRTAWLALFVLLLVCGTPAAVWFAWRRFRREFVGLQATLDELREDLRWLEEYLPNDTRQT